MLYISERQYRRFEAGNAIKLEYVADIAEILDVDVDYLITGTSNEEFKTLLESISPEKIDVVREVLRVLSTSEFKK